VSLDNPRDFASAKLSIILFLGLVLALTAS
jgi:hypothetical protein